MADLEATAELWRLADVYDCGYREGGLSLRNFRLDPAPAEVQPRLTETEALNVFSEGPFGNQLRQAVPRAFARFGLFSGADIFDATDGDLGPTTEVRLRPSWLVVIRGLKAWPSGAATLAWIATHSKGGSRQLGHSPRLRRHRNQAIRLYPEQRRSARSLAAAGAPRSDDHGRAAARPDPAIAGGSGRHTKGVDAG